MEHVEAPEQPLLQRVEDQLGAAKCIFAPASDLIMHCQTQALLELRACVGDVPPYKPFHLHQMRTPENFVRNFRCVKHAPYFILSS